MYDEYCDNIMWCVSMGTMYNVHCTKNTVQYVFLVVKSIQLLFNVLFLYMKRAYALSLCGSYTLYSIKCIMHSVQSIHCIFYITLSHNFAVHHLYIQVLFSKGNRTESYIASN